MRPRLVERFRREFQSEAELADFLQDFWTGAVLRVPQVQSPATLVGWLMTKAGRHVGRFRQRVRGGVVGRHTIPLYAEDESGLAAQDRDILDRIADASVVEHLMSALSPSQAEVARLALLEQLPHADVAHRLGFSNVGTVKVKLSRIRTIWRGMLDEQHARASEARRRVAEQLLPWEDTVGSTPDGCSPDDEQASRRKSSSAPPPRRAVEGFRPHPRSAESADSELPSPPDARSADD